MRVETIGAATLYLGDCREILPTLGKVDAVVTDPPYGIGYRPQDWKSWTGKSLNRAPIVGDDTQFDPSFLLGFPHVLLWGANYFSSSLPNGQWLVWDKRCHERGDKMFGASIEIAWCGKGVAQPKIKRILHGGVVNADSEIGNNKERLHPTQKPVALMRWSIEQLPADCATIADPFMGSGTTGVACVKMGRKFIGIEIESKYFDIACRRIEEADRQKDLFIETKDDAVAASMPELLL